MSVGFGVASVFGLAWKIVVGGISVELVAEGAMVVTGDGGYLFTNCSNRNQRKYSKDAAGVKEVES